MLGTRERTGTLLTRLPPWTVAQRTDKSSQCSGHSPEMVWEDLLESGLPMLQELCLWPCFLAATRSVCLCVYRCSVPVYT
jgi:hypothetical protein